jgi:hypothetical protein
MTVNWQAEAYKMLKTFPQPPQQGWESWVQNPTPVEFDLGFIDLVQKIIWVYPGGVHPQNVTDKKVWDLSQFAVDPTPLIDQIPGKLTCLFPKPMAAGDAWYRDEQGALIDASWRKTPEGERYQQQKSEADNRHFEVLIKRD